MKINYLISIDTFNDISSILSITSTCLPFSLVIPIIIVSVLFMDINSILDTEQDYQRRLRDSRRRPMVDLYFVDSTCSNNTGNYCMVHDRNDPTGVNLSALFALRGYTFETQNGRLGIRIQSGNRIEKNYANPALDQVKLPALNVTLHGEELRGMIIFSHNQPITRRVGAFTTTLLIKKINLTYLVQ